MEILYKYIKMELEQFALFDENINSEVGDVQMQTSTVFNFGKEQNVLCNKIAVTYLLEGKTLMKAVMNSYFLIHEDSVKAMTDENNHVIFNTDILTQFASLNYGSLRGVLYLKTADTPLSRHILPPVYFNRILKEGYVVE